ncbi:hypothetical protein [Fundidesulfovibrio soli]|uniref:hypothetical protein n=1 Tax=Fundidesulfovibrio soli TaxID=2922716 RepID=UPI001FAF6161|nr:hypothetical protein [Fundidesulfovibrio soli]
MKKKILTVECELASDDTVFVDFQSKSSLLDWDIIIFKPAIHSFLYSHTNEQYQGKPCLSDSNSVRLKECCEHWRREIKQAVESGKTVVVYASELSEVYVDTGQRTFSGTGRNKTTTRLVSIMNNYQSIPANISPIQTCGSSIKTTPKYAEILKPYWEQFESLSQYKVIFSGESVPACLATRVGDKAVGALYKSKMSNGSLLVLPDVNFSQDDFLEEIENKDGSIDECWSDKATAFANRLISCIVSLDKALRCNSEVTPEPTWASTQHFSIGAESGLRLQLLAAEKEVERVQNAKEQIVEQLNSICAMRGLLFEKGKPLENMIIEALNIMGFNASQYKDSTSEFDVVFESDEGRLIGEAEGKDNKPINIDKFRQLTLNIHEDLQREEVTSPAKPVLFGNGFRLLPLQDRPDPFTEKCHTSAPSTNTALLFTPDLFFVTQYLLDNNDRDFAYACRIAILTTTGRVVFPQPPARRQVDCDTQADTSS